MKSPNVLVTFNFIFEFFFFNKNVTKLNLIFVANVLIQLRNAEK